MNYVNWFSHRIYDLPIHEFVYVFSATYEFLPMLLNLGYYPKDFTSFFSNDTPKIHIHSFSLNSSQEMEST